MKKLILYLNLLLLAFFSLAESKPNIVFFAVDDMNDWIGPMGSKMAQTPNLDRLAKMGVTFQNGHTAGIYCAPSRSAIFTGRYATTTGCYSDEIYFYDHPEYKPLQLAFHEVGYNTYGTGKLFHHPAGQVDQRGWTEFMIRSKEQKENGWAMDTWAHGSPLPAQYPASKYNQINKKWKGKPFMEVGSIPNEKESELVDTRRTDWACEIIKKKHDKPFFLAIGLYAPHYPNYAPQRFFDMYPIESVKQGPIKADDLDDLPAKIKKKAEGRKKAVNDKLEKLGSIETTVQGYLACISYADYNLGKVLDTLEKSGKMDNTIIVFWSDHGYAQGEKGHWGKHTMWQRTSNVPFLWAGPGIAKDKSTDNTASLVDMYPTLLDLCGLTPDQGHDGKSLKPVLEKPEIETNRSILLPHDHPGSYAIINEDFRYIYYKDAGEELYDVRKDLHEWTNLAENPEYAKTKAKMKAMAPTNFAPRGTAKKTIKIVVDGESFKWVPKK